MANCLSKLGFLESLDNLLMIEMFTIIYHISHLTVSKEKLRKKERKGEKKRESDQ